MIGQFEGKLQRSGFASEDRLQRNADGDAPRCKQSIHALLYGPTTFSKPLSGKFLFF